MTKTKQVVLSPDSELDQQEGVESSTVAVMEPPQQQVTGRYKVDRPRDAGLSESVGFASHDEYEQTLLKVSDGTATLGDHTRLSVRGVVGEVLEREISRVSQVRKCKAMAGTWKQLEELKAKAEQIRQQTASEQEKIEADLAEYTTRANQRLAELRTKANEADAEAARMERANNKLRELVPEHVRKFARTQARLATSKIGPQINELNNQIGPREAVIAKPLDANILASITPRSVPQQLHDMQHLLRCIGHNFGDNWGELVAALPNLRKQFAEELPAMKEEFQRLEQQRIVAISEAATVLDVYLPA